MKKILTRWFRRRPSPFSDGDIPHLTPDDFRSSEPLVVGLRRIFRDSTFKVALRTIEDAKPVGIPQPGTQPMDFAFNYGVMLGYTMALDNLRSLAEAAEHKEVEATFAHNPEQPAEEEIPNA